MSSTTTSADAMSRLTKAYANCSRTHIMSLKERLASITKGDSSVSNYLCSIRSIADELALIDHPVDDLDLVIAALNGLGSTFREFTASIRTRDTPLLFDELYDKLVDYEIFLQRDERQQQSLPITANHASRSSFTHGRSKQPLQFLGVTPSGCNTPSSAPPTHGRRISSSSSTLVCQFCDKHGHTAKTYYKLHGYPPNHPRHQANMVHKDSGSDTI